MTKASAFRAVDFAESGWREINSGNVGTSTLTTVTSADAFSVIAVDLTTTYLVRIPNNNFPRGFQTVITRLGTGALKIDGQPSANIVLRAAPGIGTTPSLAARNSVASIIYSGSPTTGWLVFGDLI
jgi:hypothetical protein